MTTWPPSDTDLAAIAEGHLAYEMRTLWQQVRDPRLSYNAWDAHTSDSLLEAALVHLRVLDEFLTMPAARTGPDRPRDNVVAEHYTGTTLAGFLTRGPDGDDELGDINAQLSHLAVRRRESRLWPVTDMACRCGKAMQQFVTAARPEFKPALSEVRIQADRLAGLCGTDPMVMTSTN